MRAWRACILPALAGILASPAVAAFLDFSGPMRQFEIVRHALRDELWSIAARRADAAAKEKGKAMEAHLAKLEALAGDGRYADMLAQLDGWDESADAFRYWRAWALERLGRDAEARKALEAEFSDPALSALAHRLRARLAVRSGVRKAAEESFRLAAVAVATNAHMRAENAVEWAESLAGFGDAVAAIAVLKSENALDVPGTAGDFARSLAADLLDRTGREAESDAMRQRLVAAGTNTDERVFVEAACTLARRQKDRAKRLELAGKAVARARRGELRREAGYLLGAIELEHAKTRAQGKERIKRLVKEVPEPADSRAAALALADALLAAGDAEAAATEYRIFLETYPDVAVSGDARVLEGRGWAQLALGRRTEAIGTFARAAQVATNDAVKARCLYKQGDALMADGRFDEAAELFGRVARMGGELAGKARFSHADAMERAGHVDEAVAAFRAIADSGSAEAAEAELRLAVREVADRRFDQAIATFARILERKDISAGLRERALAGRGRACYRAYRFKDAAADFGRVAELAPARSDEMSFLSALCTYGDGREAEAKKQIEMLYKSAKDERLLYDLMLWIARYDASHGNWKAAEDGFEKYALACTNRPLQAADALVRAARVAGARSDYAKAVNLITKAVNMAPTAPFLADALIVQGEALMILARYDDAVLVLDRAMLASPGTAVARRAATLKADALFSMGADDGARYVEALGAYRALASDTGLTPSARLAVAFKIGRTLEKMRRFDDAADQYYSGVVLAYTDACRKGKWFDDSARAFFARAAFALADHYEAKGWIRQAEGVLKHVAESDVPAADEARKRLARLEAKGRMQ